MYYIVYDESTISSSRAHSRRLGRHSDRNVLHTSSPRNVDESCSSNAREKYSRVSIDLLRVDNERPVGRVTLHRPRI